MPCMRAVLAILAVLVAFCVVVGPFALANAGAVDLAHSLWQLTPWAMGLCAAVAVGVVVLTQRAPESTRWGRIGAWVALLLVVTLWALPSLGMRAAGMYPLDDPRVVSAEEADELLLEDDLVMGIVVEGQARAYPLRYLMTHEIVNDRLADTPLVATY